MASRRILLAVMVLTEGRSQVLATMACGATGHAAQCAMEPFVAVFAD